jgi:hypothetical protein
MMIFRSLMRTMMAEVLAMFWAIDGLFQSIHRAQKPADSTPFIVHVSLASWRCK